LIRNSPPLFVAKATNLEQVWPLFERFYARGFDAIRDMLAEEVRLKLVARTRINGKVEVRSITA